MSNRLVYVVRADCDQITNLQKVSVVLRRYIKTDSTTTDKSYLKSKKFE